ncbi:hypothetical protein BC829DRAFT_170966 [Chytridium lagenaria]|nr:hypothetical protein BC829DRAFT_170966 [Chytridium lagenaria]
MVLSPLICFVKRRGVRVLVELGLGMDPDIVGELEMFSLHGEGGGDWKGGGGGRGCGVGESADSVPLWVFCLARGWTSSSQTYLQGALKAASHLSRPTSPPLPTSNSTPTPTSPTLLGEITRRTLFAISLAHTLSSTTPKLSLPSRPTPHPKPEPPHNNVFGENVPPPTPPLVVTIPIDIPIFHPHTCDAGFTKLDATSTVRPCPVARANANTVVELFDALKRNGSKNVHAFTPSPLCDMRVSKDGGVTTTVRRYSPAPPAGAGYTTGCSCSSTTPIDGFLRRAVNVVKRVGEVEVPSGDFMGEVRRIEALEGVREAVEEARRVGKERNVGKIVMPLLEILAWVCVERGGAVLGGRKWDVVEEQGLRWGGVDGWL